MKTNTRKPLRLDTETLKTLTDRGLDQVIGGNRSVHISRYGSCVDNYCTQGC
jgi:hypothetical protein